MSAELKRWADHTGQQINRINENIYILKDVLKSVIDDVSYMKQEIKSLKEKKE